MHELGRFGSPCLQAKITFVLNKALAMEEQTLATAQNDKEEPNNKEEEEEEEEEENQAMSLRTTSLCPRWTVCV
jgi:hypothetical protein